MSATRMIKEKETVRQILQAMADASGGRLTPEQVVEAAKHPDHELHAYFDWDDKEAARQWRLDQARTLIRSVRVKFTVETLELKVPYFVRDPEVPRGQQGYSTVPRLRSEADLAREAVLAEFKVASSAIKRAMNLAAVLEMTDELAALQKQISVMQAKLTPPSRRGTSRRAQ